MKTLNKIMFIACLIFAIICLPVTLIVSAKGAEINQVSDVNTAWETIKTDFVIQKGASIRLTDDTTSGLRFATTISKANEQSFNALKDKGLEIGILIMPKDLLKDNELKTDTVNVLDVKTPNAYTKNEGALEFRAVLTEIPDTKYTREFVARGYITYNNETIYTDTVTRDISYVAYAAQQDGQTGTEKFIKREYFDINLPVGATCEYKYAYKGQVLQATLPNTVFDKTIENTYELANVDSVKVNGAEFTNYTKNVNNVVFNQSNLLPTGENVDFTFTTKDTNNITINYNTKIDVADKVINTQEDFLKIYEYMKTDEKGVYDGYVVLGNDIDLSQKIDYKKRWATGMCPFNYDNLANDWGVLESYKGLVGTFDGRGHTVKGLQVATFGLFNNIASTGVVKNVAFTDVRFDGTDAAVFARHNNGTIDNVFISISDTKHGSGNTGGFCQFVNAGGNVTNCVVKFNTKFNENAGAICFRYLPSGNISNVYTITDDDSVIVQWKGGIFNEAKELTFNNKEAFVSTLTKDNLSSKGFGDYSQTLYDSFLNSFN